MTAAPVPAPEHGKGRGADGEPRRVEQIDEGLLPAVRQFHRARWVLVTVAFVVLISAVGTLAFGWVSDHAALIRQETQQKSSCGFWDAAAGLEVQPPGPLQRPSLAIVTIVAAARYSFIGNGCPGQLPPVSKSEKQWAAFYHVPVS